jgi:hypothetical protein
MRASVSEKGLSREPASSAPICRVEKRLKARAAAMGSCSVSWSDRDTVADTRIGDIVNDIVAHINSVTHAIPRCVMGNGGKRNR